MVATSSSRTESDGLLGHPPSPLVLRICGTEYDGREVRLQAAKCTIGSGPDCTFRLRAAGVRPLHCLILRGRQGAVIRRWSVGTHLNGRRFSDSPLLAGDRISIGPVELEVVSICNSSEAADCKQEVRHPEDSTELVASLEARIAQLEAELEAEPAPPAESASAPSSDSPYEGASQPQELRRELDRTRDDLARERREAESQRREMEVQLAQARQQAESLRRQLANAEERQQSSCERDKAHQTELDQVRAELEAARRATHTSGDLKGKLQAAEAETAKWRDQADWWRRRAEQIEIESRQIAQSQRHRSDTEVREPHGHERDELQRQQDQWRQEREQLQRDAETRADEFEQQLSRQKQKADEALAQLESERALLAQTRSELAEVKSERDRLAETHRERCDAWNVERGQLLDQRASEEQQRTEFERKFAEQQQQFEEERGNRDAEQQRLTLEFAEQAQSLEATKAELKQSQNEIANADELHRQQLEAWESRQRELKQQLSAKEEQLQELSRQLDDAQQQAASLEREYGQAKEELHKKNQQFDKELPRVQREQEAWEVERNRLEAELEARTRKIAEQHAELQHQRDGLHSEWESLRAERRQFEDQRCVEAIGAIDAGEAPEPVETPPQLQAGQGDFGQPSPTAVEQGGDAPSNDSDASSADEEIAFEAPSENMPVSAQDVLSRMGQPPCWNEEEPTAPVEVEEQVEPQSQPQPNADSPSIAETEDEESIEEYMARLLKRVRGDEDASSSPPTTAVYSPPSPEPPAAETESDAPQPPSPVADFKAETGEYRPRSQAPELTTNLKAMRELANESARTAIDSSTRRRGSTAAGSKFLLAGVASLIGVVLLFVPGTYALCGALALFIIGLLFAVQGVVHTRRYLRAVRKQRELDKVKQATKVEKSGGSDSSEDGGPAEPAVGEANAADRAPT